MDLDNSNDQEVDLVELANNILAIFNSSAKIESEEDLFSDEFYISIFSILLQDEELQLEPGKTAEEKVENLKGLLDYLSNVLEIDLSKIDAKDIIVKHNKESAKELLELLSSIIQTLIKANLEQMGDEDIELEDDTHLGGHSLNDNKLNLSEKKASEKMRIDKDEEINLENLESLRLGKDKDKDKDKEKKKAEEKKETDKEEEKILTEEKKETEKEEDIKLEKTSNKKDKKDEDAENELKYKNSSTNKKSSKKEEDEDEDVEYLPKSFNKQIEKEEMEEDDNINNLKEKEIADMNLFNDSNDMKVNNIIDSEKNSSKKKSNDIPNLLDADENTNKKKKKSIRRHSYIRPR